MTTSKFELTFWGSVPVRYRRFSPTFEAAEQRALDILAKIENRFAHPAIVYGPGCGRNGVTIN